MYQKLLKQLKLNPNQIQIYQILLKEGPHKAKDLVAKTGLHRSLVYKTLELLSTQKLVTENKAAGSVTKFSITPPQQLQEIVDIQQQQQQQTQQLLNKLLPQLRSDYNLSQNRPNIQHFEGWDTIKKYLLNTLDHNEQGLIQILKILPNHKNKNQLYHWGKDVFKPLRISKKIRLQTILLTTEPQAKFTSNPLELSETLELPYIMEELLTSALFLTKKTVSTHNFTNEPLITKSPDKNLYQLLNILFKYLWQNKKPVS